MKPNSSHWIFFGQLAPILLVVAGIGLNSISQASQVSGLLPSGKLDINFWQDSTRIANDSAVSIQSSSVNNDSLVRVSLDSLFRYITDKSVAPIRESRSTEQRNKSDPTELPNEESISTTVYNQRQRLIKTQTQPINQLTKNKKPVHVSISQQTVNGLLSLLLLFIVSSCGCMGAIFIMSTLTVIESLQTRGNCYLVSLSMSHLLVTLFVLPSSALYIMAGDSGIDGRRLCHFQWLTLEFSLIVGQLSFLLMAADNYLGYKCSEKVKTKLGNLDACETAPIGGSSVKPVQGKNQGPIKDHLPPPPAPQTTTTPWPEESNPISNANCFSGEREVPTGTQWKRSYQQQQEQCEKLSYTTPQARSSMSSIFACHSLFPSSLNTRLTQLALTDQAVKKTPDQAHSSPKWLTNPITRLQVRSNECITKTPNSPNTKLHTNDRQILSSGKSQQLTLAARFQLSQQEKNIDAKLIRSGLFSYRLCCGRLRVLIWILSIWMLAFAYTIHEHELSFGHDFCTLNQASIAATGERLMSQTKTYLNVGMPGNGGTQTKNRRFGREASEVSELSTASKLQNAVVNPYASTTQALSSSLSHHDPLGRSVTKGGRKLQPMGAKRRPSGSHLKSREACQGWIVGTQRGSRTANLTSELRGAKRRRSVVDQGEIRGSANELDTQSLHSSFSFSFNSSSSSSSNFRSNSAEAQAKAQAKTLAPPMGITRNLLEPSRRKSGDQINLGMAQHEYSSPPIPLSGQSKSPRENSFNCITCKASSKIEKKLSSWQTRAQLNSLFLANQSSEMANTEGMGPNSGAQRESALVEIELDDVRAKPEAKLGHRKQSNFHEQPSGVTATTTMEPSDESMVKAYGNNGQTIGWLGKQTLVKRPHDRYHRNVRPTRGFSLIDKASKSARSLSDTDLKGESSSDSTKNDCTSPFDMSCDGNKISHELEVHQTGKVKQRKPKYRQDDDNPNLNSVKRLKECKSDVQSDCGLIDKSINLTKIKIRTNSSGRMDGEDDRPISLIDQRSPSKLESPHFRSRRDSNLDTNDQKPYQISVNGSQTDEDSAKASRVPLSAISVRTNAKKSKYFHLILVGAIILPSMASAILFARAYISMKAFKNRPYNTLPIEALNQMSLTSLITGDNHTQFSLTSPQPSPTCVVHSPSDQMIEQCDGFSSDQPDRVEKTTEMDIETSNMPQDTIEQSSVMKPESQLRVKRADIPQRRSSSQPSESADRLVEAESGPIAPTESVTSHSRALLNPPIGRSTKNAFNWFPNQFDRPKSQKYREELMAHYSNQYNLLNRTPSERYTSNRVCPSEFDPASQGLGMQRDISFSAPPTAGVRQNDWDSGKTFDLSISQAANKLRDLKAASNWTHKNNQPNRLMSVDTHSSRAYEFRRHQNHAQSFHYGSSFRHHYPHLSSSGLHQSSLVRTRPPGHVNQLFLSPDSRGHQQLLTTQSRSLCRSPDIPELISIGDRSSSMQTQQTQHDLPAAFTFHRQNTLTLPNESQDSCHLERHLSLPRSSRLYQSRDTVETAASLTDQHLDHKSGHDQYSFVHSKQPLGTNVVNIALARVIEPSKTIQRDCNEQLQIASSSGQAEIQWRSNESCNDQRGKSTEDPRDQQTNNSITGEDSATSTATNRLRIECLSKMPVSSDTSAQSLDTSAATTGAVGRSSSNSGVATLCTYSYMPDDQLLRSNIIVFAFNITLWLPFVLIWLGDQHGRNMSQEVKDLVWWITTINCCSCAYLYALTNKDFREAFNKLFYYFCCKSHVTFARKTPIFRRQLDMDSRGNLRVHIIPGLNLYSNKLSKGGDSYVFGASPILGSTSTGFQVSNYDKSGENFSGLATGRHHLSATTVGLGHLPLAWHHSNYRAHEQSGISNSHNSGFSDSHHYQNQATSSGTRTRSHQRYQTSSRSGSAYRQHHMSASGGFGGPLLATPTRLFGSSQGQSRQVTSERRFARSSDRIRASRSQQTPGSSRGYYLND